MDHRLAHPPSDEERKASVDMLAKMHPGNRLRIMLGMETLPEPDPANVAQEAYIELLNAPMTTDPRQYRMNIIMAYMMGQVSQQQPNPQPGKSGECETL